jgi:hypothetical protein
MSNQTTGQINPDFELSPEAALQINIDLVKFMGCKKRDIVLCYQQSFTAWYGNFLEDISKKTKQPFSGYWYKDAGLEFTTNLNWLAHVSRKVFDFILTIQNDDDRAHEILSDVDDLWHSAAIWMGKNKPQIAALKIHECITAINKYNEQTGS